METSSKLKSLFIDALALPASDRSAFLDSECTDDPTLRERVEALLAANDEAGEYLAEPTLGAAALHGLSGEGPGATIGAYKLLELIGEGGFGVVYMAEQREPVRRRVALKVIKPGMDTRQVIGRFEQERQALAMMDHPNIAKVLDAGATRSGRPYFVMELVRGDLITAYADAYNLSIPQRLELFQQVCHAVQHAHQKGIIHRDLKPSNILVAEIDGRLTPRIIDFGIAKATGGAGVQLTDKTVFTEFRQFIGTPEYMSPEQAGIDAADIDTRSDIYSLGVLLYALLTGGPPFDPKHLRSATWEEMRRIIREDEPQRPSTRLHMRQDTREIAAHRQTEPSRLIGLVRGDLDWIVMKCLEKDRARRYETANGLAMDIARHLGGEPVMAAPPSRSYRARKFLRKYRAQAIVGSVIAALLVAAVAGTTTFAVREAHQRVLADRIARFQGKLLKDIKAPAMAARLREDIVSEAEVGWGRMYPNEQEKNAERRKQLGSLLDAANFTNAVTRSLDKSIFEPAVATLGQQFADEPLTRATMLQDLADTMCGLNILDGAMVTQSEALAIRAQLLRSDDPDMLASVFGRAQILFEQSKWKDAEPDARRAWEGRRRVLGEDDPDTCKAAYLLANVLARVQDVSDEAELILRNLYDLQRNALGENDQRTLETLFRVGRVIYMREDARMYESGRIIETATKGLRQVLPEADRTLLEAEVALAGYCGYVGRLDESVEILERVLPVMHAVFGDDNWMTWYNTDVLASALRDQGRFAEAMPIIEDAVKALPRVLGDGNLHYYRLALGTKVGVLRGLGDFEGAAAAGRDVTSAYGGMEKTPPWQLFWIAGALDKTGDPDDTAAAESMRAHCIDLATQYWNQNNARAYGETLSGVAWNHYLVGHFAEAENLAAQAVAGLRTLAAPDDSLMDALGNLAVIRRVIHGPEAALPPFEEVRRARRQSGGIHLLGAEIWAQHSECLLDVGQFAEAERVLAEGVQAFVDADFPKAPVRIMKAYIKMYRAWDVAEPGVGHDARANEWFARLPDFARSVDPPMPGQ